MHTHIQVAIFQIRFPNEAQVQNVLKETAEVMIKKSTFLFCARLRLFAPVWAYLRPKLRPDFRKNLNEFPTSGPQIWNMPVCFPKLGRSIAAILNQMVLGPGVCKERSRIHKVLELRFPLD